MLFGHAVDYGFAFRFSALLLNDSISFIKNNSISH
jgi:hypothetical protein